MQEEEHEEVHEDQALPVDQVADDQEEGVTDDTADRPVEGSKEYNFAALEESKRRSDEKASQALKEVEMARDYAKRLEKLLPSNDKKEVEEVDEPYDFSDAVDSEYFQKMNARMDAREKKFLKRQEEQDERFEKIALKEKDGDYVETINKYLPSVLEDDADIADIIRSTPKAKRMKMMLKFAKVNPQYHADKKGKPVQAESKIEKNLARTQTLGALPSNSKSTVKENDVWAMDSEQFAAHMQKVRQG
jgi:hypothetical protein